MQCRACRGKRVLKMVGVRTWVMDDQSGVVYVIVLNEDGSVALSVEPGEANWLWEKEGPMTPV
jgi:hypothetical protein